MQECLGKITLVQYVYPNNEPGMQIFSNFQTLIKDQHLIGSTILIHTARFFDIIVDVDY